MMREFMKGQIIFAHSGIPQLVKSSISEPSPPRLLDAIWVDSHSAIHMSSESGVGDDSVSIWVKENSMFLIHYNQKSKLACPSNVLTSLND